MKAEFHFDEAKRIEALQSYGILDTPRESDFDDVVKVASEICDVPISVINLIDNGRQWFKAEVGLGVRETPLDTSICAHAILQPGLFMVPDTFQDPRFADNPLVTSHPHLRFYAGALLETPDGLPLGTVCVLDTKPRMLNATQQSFLRLMASQVMKQLELRKSVVSEHSARLRAELLLTENETLAREGDHRVMNSLQLVQSVLSLQSRNARSAEAKMELETARDRVMAIATVHKQLHLTGSLDEIEVEEFLQRLCESLGQNAPSRITRIDVTADKSKLRSDLASSLGMVVAELIANSFKHAYAEGASGPVSVDFKRAAEGWVLRVSDNGRGVPADFDPAQSKGVGMRAVLALTRRLNAKLDVDSQPGKTVFTVTAAS